MIFGLSYFAFHFRLFKSTKDLFTFLCSCFWNNFIEDFIDAYLTYLRQSTQFNGYIKYDHKIHDEIGSDYVEGKTTSTMTSSTTTTTATTSTTTNSKQQIQNNNELSATLWLMLEQLLWEYLQFRNRFF